MVNKILLFFSLILLSTFSFGQTLDNTFNGYLLPIVHVGKSGDTLSFRGKFVNSAGQYDGTELSTNSILIAEEDANCYYLPIVSITSSGSIISADVLSDGSLSTIPAGQAAIGTPTPQKGLFPNVANISSTLASCIFNYNYAILDREETPDTISQLSHGFSVGTAVRKSGDWIQVLDTSRTSIVEAIVVDNISANVFAVQYKGKFRLDNVYTIGKQLYVQPDGSYSIVDTSNHVIYGYALNSRYIQIGQKPSEVITKDYVDNNIVWDSTYTYDSLQTITNPADGNIYLLNTLESKNERPDLFPGVWTKITTENPASISYVNSLVISSSYTSKFQRANTNITVSADSIATYENYKIVVKNAGGDTTSVTLPNPTSTLVGKSPIVIDSSAIGGETYLLATSGIKLRINDNFSERYYLDRGESVTLTYTDSTIIINSNTKAIVYNSTLDFEKRVREGSKINFKGGEYLVQKALPASGVDNLFVKQVKLKNVYGSNQFAKSREAAIHGGGGLNQWNLSDAIRPTTPSLTTNLAVSIYGEKDADALIADDTGSKRMGQLIDVGSHASGTKFTMSFLLKAAEASTNDNFVVSSFRLVVTGGSEYTFASSGFTPNTTDKHWEQYTYTGVFPIDIDTTITPRMYFTADVGDTLYIDNFQFEITPSASDFKFTDSTPTNSSDTSYAVYQPVNQLIDLNQVYRSENISDNLFVQQALDYCEATGLCVGVIPIDGMTFTDSILLHPLQIIDGLEGKTIYADVNSTTKSVFFCERGPGVYTQGQEIKNLTIAAISDAFAIINGNNGLNQRFNKLTITGDYDPGVDSVEYGIYIGATDGGAAAIDTKILNSNITGCYVGVRYQNVGNLHTVYNTVSSRNSFGIWVDGALVDIDKCDIETNSIAAIYYSDTGGNVDIDKTYVENGAYTFSGIERFSFTRGRTSGGIFSVDNVKLTNVSENALSDGSNVIPVVGSRLGALNLTGNRLSAMSDLNTIIGLYKNSTGINISGNYLTDRDKIQDIGYYGRIHAHHSNIENSILNENTRLADTLTVTNLTVRGKRENLIPSDSIQAADGVYTDYSIFNNVIEAPDGTMTADLFVSTATVGGTSSFGSFPILNGVSVGETFVISFYAKDMKQDGYSETRMNFRTEISMPTISAGKTFNKEWTRYMGVVDSSYAATTTLTRRITSQTLGDSIAYWGWQVNRGDEMLPLVRTGTIVGVEDNYLGFDILGKLNADTLQAQIIKDSDGDAGTNGQKLKSTGTGTNWVDDTGTINTASTGEIAVYTSSATIDGSPILSDKTTYIEASAPIHTIDGSASVPSFTFTTDPNSGLYSTGADALGVSLGGNVTAEFTTSGLSLASGDTYRVDNTPIYTRGVFTDTTTGSGELIIPHTMGTTPGSYMAQVVVDGASYYVGSITVDATNITVIINDRSSNLAATTVSVTVSWNALK